MEITLSNLELERYDRQLLISGWGKDGQKKLKSAKVVVMGAGGLGCPASLYLAAAGVGKLMIIDKDKFETNNLNRQILGWQKDIGHFKSEAAAEKLRELNSYIEITPLILEIKEDNIHEHIENASVVVDAMDNWRTRFLINKACLEKEIPFVHASIFGLYGQLTTIIPSKGPCLRCIIPNTPKEVATFPVLGATPAFFATLQVMETLKLIVGFEKTLTGRMLVFDGKYMDFLIINVEKRLECPICSIG